MIEKKIGVPCENNMVDQVGTYTPSFFFHIKSLLIILALFSIGQFINANASWLGIEQIKTIITHN